MIEKMKYYTNLLIIFSFADIGKEKYRTDIVHSYSVGFFIGHHFEIAHASRKRGYMHIAILYKFDYNYK